MGSAAWLVSNTPDVRALCQHAAAKARATASICRAFADDDVDAVLFRKIKSGRYDADDPIWDSISVSAKDLVVSPSICI